MRKLTIRSATTFAMAFLGVGNTSCLPTDPAPPSGDDTGGKSTASDSSVVDGSPEADASGATVIGDADAAADSSVDVTFLDVKGTLDDGTKCSETVVQIGTPGTKPVAWDGTCRLAFDEASGPTDPAVPRYLAWGYTDVFPAARRAAMPSQWSIVPRTSGPGGVPVSAAAIELKSYLCEELTCQARIIEMHYGCPSPPAYDTETVTAPPAVKCATQEPAGCNIAGIYEPSATSCSWKLASASCSYTWGANCAGSTCGCTVNGIATGKTFAQALPCGPTAPSMAVRYATLRDQCGFPLK